MNLPRAAGVDRVTDRLFFYGTLRHLPLLETVLGRVPDALVPAVLRDHSALAVTEGPFPLLVPRPGAQAEGVVASGLTPDDIARLDFYEGGFDYDLVEVMLSDGTAARVYVCAPDRWQAQDAWDFAQWRMQWADMSCHAAQEVMGHFGTRSRAEIDAMFPQIRVRAWSRVQGAQTRAGQGVFVGAVDVVEHHRAYTGFFAVDEVSLRHTRFDGSLSPLLHRSYFIGGDAALVLPYDPLRDRVMLVEQLRMGPFGRGDTEVWHLEPIAGRIDPGETAEQTARREAVEEAGLHLDRLETVARGYPSPGDSTGYFNIFVGLADLPDSAAGLGGLATESEDIRTRLISFDDFLAMAEACTLANTPVALLAYWLAHHRSRLRSGSQAAT